MKLVIDIHKKDYQSILNSGQVPYGVVCAIMNGTPLPKGHGRLVKEDDVYDAFRPYVGFGDLYDVLDEIPTIIEADKESEE